MFQHTLCLVSTKNVYDMCFLNAICMDYFVSFKILPGPVLKVWPRWHDYIAEVAVVTMATVLEGHGLLCKPGA